MTKKDYIKIANVFKAVKPEEKMEVIDMDYFNSIVSLFMDMLESDNPRFNRETFINYINQT